MSLGRRGRDATAQVGAGGGGESSDSGKGGTTQIPKEEARRGIIAWGAVYRLGRREQHPRGEQMEKLGEGGALRNAIFPQVDSTSHTDASLSYLPKTSLSAHCISLLLIQFQK